jgi:hypothetical protein
VLSIEHRAAAAPAPVTIELVATDPSTTHLAVKNERLGVVLQALEQAGCIHHTASGWQRAR